MIPQKDRNRNYLGFEGCPICATNSTYCNIGRDHWFYCEKHRTKWWVGSNLLSSWQFETEDHWKRNEVFLAAYREVQPIIDRAQASDWKAMMEAQIDELEDKIQALKETIPPDPDDDPF
jgi:hypothetical protein